MWIETRVAGVETVTAALLGLVGLVRLLGVVGLGWGILAWLLWYAGLSVRGIYRVVGGMWGKLLWRCLWWYY